MHLEEVTKPVAKIKSTLDIQLDLTRPIEELTEVISAAIASQPARRKEKYLKNCI